MAILIKGNHIGEVWSDLLKKLIHDGIPIAPRDIGTREILNVSLEIKNGLKNILINPIRDINYRFMVAEWLWILGGLNEVAPLVKYNSIMKVFSDDGQILSGAYGPRLMPQWDYVIESLKKIGSRQAVSTIWSAIPLESRDIPCTISIQWFIRQKLLHCTVNMRSSDVWLGLPYDYFTFSQLTNFVAMKTGFGVGSVTMNLGSSHLYDSNFNQACAAAWVPTDYVESPRLPIFTNIPKPHKIEKILAQKPFALNLAYPWIDYAESLLIDKANALEVLRGLEPFK